MGMPMIDTRANTEFGTRSIDRGSVPEGRERLTLCRVFRGLAAAVLTNDMQKALDLSLRLESGMVHVNDTTIADEPHVPFGGTKNSGFGREGGRYSLEELTEVKWVTMQMGKRAFPF
jgi:hypothetical protein